MVVFMTANEAIARGAYESGVRLASAYHGTPCTEIMEYINEDICCEWSINGKVGLEVARSESLAGYRSFTIMSTSDLNAVENTLGVTADSHINGGLVVIVPDDTEHESFKQPTAIPILEPADSQDAKDFIKIAFELSEEYVTPVILKLSLGVCNTKSLVEVNSDYTYSIVATPGHDGSCQKTIKVLEEECNDFEINTLELNSKEIGVITSGNAYLYAREVLPQASILKIELINPLPKKLINEIANYVKDLYVIEDGGDTLESSIKNLGVEVKTQSVFTELLK